MMSKPVENPLLEEVAYVPRHLLEQGNYLTHGFRPDHDQSLYTMLQGHVTFAAREVLETDPGRKQLIPYVVVTDGQQIWTMRRKKKQTESRLHDKLSFGVGGHIPNELYANDNAANLLDLGMQKELHEELFLEPPFHIAYRGTLNDDSTEVGEVHLGLIYTCTVPERTVKTRETDKMEGMWCTLEALKTEYSSRLESWSALLLEQLEGWLKET